MTTVETNRRRFITGLVGTGILAGTAGVAGGSTAQSNPAVVWTAEVGGTVREYAVTEGAVYVGTDQNRLREIDIESGETRARIDLETGVRAGGIKVTPEHLAIATDDDRLVVYRRGDLGSGGAEPAYRSRLAGRLMGLDSEGERVVVATRSTLSVLDLTEQSFVWQVDAADFDFKDGNAFGPPVVWTGTDILAVAGQGVAFFAPETGEREVYITHGGGHNNSYTVTNRPPLATFRAGPYVSFHGWDAHGCCPSWASMVVNTDTRDWEYRRFEGFNQSNRQDSGAVAGGTVVHQFGEKTLFRDLENEAEVETNYHPRFDGIAATDSRTFIADRSIEGVSTQVVAVSNDGYGLEWSADFNEPVSRVDTRGAYLFGINESAGRLFAIAQSGDGASLRPGTPTPELTPTPGNDGSGSDTGSDASSEADGGGSTGGGGAGPTDADAGSGERGFLTNGDGSAVAGFGVRAFSTVITIVSIVIGLAQMTSGEN